MMPQVPQYIINRVRQHEPHNYALFDGLYVVSLMLNTKYRQQRGEQFFEFASEPSGKGQYITLSSVQGALNLSFYDVKHNVWWPVAADDTIMTYTAKQIENLETDGYILQYDDPHNLFRLDFAEAVTKRLEGVWESRGGEVLCGRFKYDVGMACLTNDGFIYGRSRFDIESYLKPALDRVELAYGEFKRFDLTEIYNQTIRGELSFEEFTRLLKGFER